MGSLVVFSTFLIYIGWALLAVITFAVPLFFLGYIWKEDEIYSGEEPWHKRGIARTRSLLRRQSKWLGRQQYWEKERHKREGMAKQRADAELSDVHKSA